MDNAQPTDIHAEFHSWRAKECADRFLGNPFDIRLRLRTGGFPVALEPGFTFHTGIFIELARVVFSAQSFSFGKTITVHL